jgi:cytochrome c553
MKRFLATSLVTILALSCGEKKVEEKTEAQGQAAKPAETAPAAGDASGTKPAAPAKKLTELYPPAIGVYPLSAPAPGRSLYFGVVPGGAQTFEMIWVYAVAAVPDFSNALELPEFATEAEFDAWMEKWATEFQANPEMVARLTKLQTEFSFKVDPAFITDAVQNIPAAALAGQPNYVKVTQKFYARRYTMKAAGNTAITATVDGANFSAPVVITAYTAAQLTAGQARYDSTATGAAGGCISCHGTATATNDAFLKHSSDYLAYGTDAEIIGLVKNAVYPDGTPMSNPNHKFTFATPADEANIVGYLRSFKPSIDKLTGVAADPAALRLR